MGKKDIERENITSLGTRKKSGAPSAKGQKGFHANSNYQPTLTILPRQPTENVRQGKENWRVFNSADGGHPKKKEGNSKETVTNVWVAQHGGKSEGSRW